MSWKSPLNLYLSKKLQKKLIKEGANDELGKIMPKRGKPQSDYSFSQ
ncbi:hypothetical protein NEOC65_002268 [Neochlamydia sp. AcF65]|nr:hypothetical protein [Neochlamydia sp. AcF65]MBS4169478.1 hypothetical protein [Neochlamydia sp. AcF95]